MPVTVRQVSVSSEPETSYFLRLAWNGRDLGSGFQAMLTDGQSAWDGEVGEDAVSKEAAELEMKKERYIQDLHQVLTGEGSLDPGYSFTLTPCHGPSSSRTLAYEKVESDIWIQLGSVSLRAHPEPLVEVRALLAHFLQQTAALENHNQRLKEENHRFRQEQQHITTEMKRYVAEKVSLEGELYTRFVLVLNEKKAKIRSLQERIAALQENSPAQRRTSGRPSEEEEDYGGSTDEDPEESPAAGPAPTTSAANTEVRSRSPLADSPSDLTDIAPCRKRRFRHQRPPDVVAKKPTPEVIPTQSRDSPVTSRRTANKQQAPQCSSDATATSRDTEDLFEDF
ncbi:DNA repair protein XRCC4 isoform X2 [Hypomesus transpacificus]|uniref:DNA repair protein XRCC4 isoform X2 n=1 Tax=Hypomesus transpacificus TaxID=137520 RepID=UPI001F0727DB|nr:DNA repair protein XRCC4 isoform X2 [Hypomesus transpacificus]